MSLRSVAPVLCAALLLSACAGESSAPGGEAGPVAGTGQDGADAVDRTGSAADRAARTQAPQDEAQQTQAAPEVIELPRGGTELFPRYRLFGYSGAPGSEAFGRLGIGDLDERVVEMEERGAEYVGSREIMPVLELIATVVHPVPGDDGMFRTYMDDEVVDDYLAAARRHEGILLLNIQPGRADFIDEVKRWEEYLLEPDVGVALDPEWAVDDDQIPGRVYGSTTGEELDEVAAYLSDLVQEHDLPEKVMVYHQVHASVVEDEGDLRPHDGIAIIKSVDGIGPPQDKIWTYDRVNENKPEHVVAGFKLFYEEDGVYGPVMTGDAVLDLVPRPQYVLFE